MSCLQRVQWLLLGLVLSQATGCAACMAARQPDARDLAVLRQGSTRSQVVAELGPPVHSNSQDGWVTDTHSFTQGYSQTTKTLRVAGHVAADLATGFVWELAGMPLESVYSGEAVQVEVTYDPGLRVAGVQYLKGGHLAPNPTTLVAPVPAGPPQPGPVVSSVGEGYPTATAIESPAMW